MERIPVVATMIVASAMINLFLALFFRGFHKSHARTTQKEPDPMAPQYFRRYRPAR